MPTPEEIKQRLAAAKSRRKLPTPQPAAAPAPVTPAPKPVNTPAPKPTPKPAPVADPNAEVKKILGAAKTKTAPEVKNADAKPRRKNPLNFFDW